jgi:hypothetical protein
MYLQSEFDFSEQKKMLIYVEETGYSNRQIRIGLVPPSFEFGIILKPEDLKKLVVCGLRYFRKEDPGCFHGGDLFTLGFGKNQKELSAKKILEQYPLR